jgi:hypothetical protein
MDGGSNGAAYALYARNNQGVFLRVAMQPMWSCCFIGVVSSIVVHPWIRGKTAYNAYVSNG